MTQEEKFLLLQDLCARIPYHPKGLVVNACNGAECEEWLTCATFTMFTSVTNNCRLYLRPMSSMTNEERKEIGEAIKKDHISPYGEIKLSGVDNLLLAAVNGATNLIDWLNKNHFDYRGLIERSLAVAVTKENNPYK